MDVGEPLTLNSITTMFKMLLDYGDPIYPDKECADEMLNIPCTCTWQCFKEFSLAQWRHDIYCSNV